MKLHNSAFLTLVSDHDTRYLWGWWPLKPKERDRAFCVCAYLPTSAITHQRIFRMHMHYSYLFGFQSVFERRVLKNLPRPPHPSLKRRNSSPEDFVRSLPLISLQTHPQCSVLCPFHIAFFFHSCLLCFLLYISLSVSFLLFFINFFFLFLFPSFILLLYLLLSLLRGLPLVSFCG
jgi:hypothetical protein